MPSRSMNLSKLLKLYGAPENQLISELRAELRRERDKLAGNESGGRDFYTPFWSDAKLHVLRAANINDLTKLRVKASRQRKNLYPALAKGFLDWFDQTRRGTNLSVGLSDESNHNHFELDGLGLEVKVDNLMTLRFGADRHRLVYPYFAKSPVLKKRWARVGIWAMTEAFPQESLTDLEVVDVLRGQGFRGGDVSLKGDEEFIFRERYKQIAKRWADLRPQYGLG